MEIYCVYVMGNILQPSCLKTNEGTVISVKSSCFTKPIKILISDDDDDSLEHLERAIEALKAKKASIRNLRSTPPSSPYGVPIEV